MIINLVVAASENNVIGKDNKLLWHLPNDLAFFKNTTWAMPVLMGRKTYESMGMPLKGRTNIVITSNGTFSPGLGVITVKSINEAIEAASETDSKECYIIGGGQIYKQAMPLADRIYMTRVHAQLEGDTFFPSINEEEWYLDQSTRFEADAKHAFPYSFQIWQRK